MRWTARTAMVGLVFALAGAPAGAELVYDGFDCIDAGGNPASGGDSLQDLKGATSFGFDTAGWNLSHPKITYESAGLTFGSGSTELRTTPGRALFTQPAANDGWFYGERGLNAAIGDSGPETLYGSYLFKVESQIDEISRYELILTAGGVISWGIYYGTDRGCIQATGTSRAVHSGSGPGNPGDSIMALFRVSNVGGSSGPIEIKQWFLTSAQFDHFKPDALTVAELDAAGLGSGAYQVLQRGSLTLASPSAWPDFGLDDLLNIKAYRGERYGDGHSVAVDEIRYGVRSLDDVTPVGSLGTPGLVPGADGGGVAGDFVIGDFEVAVDEYVQYLNAQTNAELVVSGGQVKLSATSDLLCLTTDAEAQSYISGSTNGNFTVVAGKANHPAIYVSWFGAAAYCNWKSAQDDLDAVYDPGSGWTAALTNSGWRLPTELEWRKAAAWDKGTAQFFRYGAGANTLSGADANYLNSGDDWEGESVRTAPVGSHLGYSPYFLKNASGNVWEWCHDLYEEGAADPASEAHALRGGAWGNLKEDCATDLRIDNAPGAVRNSVGFRIARTAQQAGT